MGFKIDITERGTVYVEVDGQWVELGVLVDAYRAHYDTLTDPEDEEK